MAAQDKNHGPWSKLTWQIGKLDLLKRVVHPGVRAGAADSIQNSELKMRDRKCIEGGKSCITWRR